jgi:hypothetical protein
MSGNSCIEGLDVFVITITAVVGSVLFAVLWAARYKPRGPLP